MLAAVVRSFGRVALLVVVAYYALGLIGRHIVPRDITAGDARHHGKPRGYMANLQQRPCVSAHRGSRHLNVENTLQAHQMALELGADVLEMDVRKTKDGVLVVFHDPDLVRVCGRAEGSIESMTLLELRQHVDVGHEYTPDGGETYPARGVGLVIPTFHEFLEAFPTAFVNVEIKENDVSVAELMFDEFALHPGIENRVVVGGRYCSVVQYVRERSDGRVATSACEQEGLAFYLLSLVHLAAPVYGFLSPPAWSVLQVPAESGGIRLDNVEFIELAHRLQAEVHYWVVNDKERMRTLVERGADCIITDRADRAVELLVSLRRRSAPRAIPEAERAPYWVPPLTPPVKHRCVSLVCHVLQNVDPLIVIAVVVLALGMFVDLLCVQPCCCRRSRRRHHRKVQ